MAQKVDFVIEQGTTWTVQITVKDADSTAINITDYTCDSQMRSSYETDTSYDITCTIAEPDSTSGILSLNLTDTQSSAINKGRYYYDVELTDDSANKTRLIEGKITVTPEVTK